MPSRAAACTPASDASQVRLAASHGITAQEITPCLPAAGGLAGSEQPSWPRWLQDGTCCCRGCARRGLDAIFGVCLRAGRISIPQMQKSQACYEQRGLRFAQQRGLPQLGAGRANLDLLRHGGSRSRARYSELTTDSNGDNNGKFAATLGWLKGAGQRPKLLYPHDAEQSVLNLHRAGIQERGTAPRWRLEGGKLEEEILFLGSGRLPEKGQSLHGSEKPTEELHRRGFSCR